MQLRLAVVVLVWLCVAVILCFNQTVNADFALVMAFLSTLALVAPEALVDRAND